jgi:isopentenyl diphosphate isomerase/L-lactate dehydrogenase-like FMN-dependent dehydrogenase
MALPFLRWAVESTERVVEGVRLVEQELRIAMWHAGAADVSALRGRARRVWPGERPAPPPAGA